MKRNRLKHLALIFLICLLTVIIFLRYESSLLRENHFPFFQPEPAEETDTIIKESENKVTEETFMNSSALSDPIDFVSETANSDAAVSDTEPAVSHDSAITKDNKRYTEKTYQLVTDIVFTFKKDPDDRDSVQGLLDSLKREDESLGIAWQKIMDYWIYVRKEMVINNTPQDHLLDDAELCIVVLGYQLFSDGTMTDELLGRCEKALLCAERYPNSYLAVCGGGTAALNRSATEARVMADWFIERGIQQDRLIMEDTSQTTVENAAFLHQILSESYPEVKNLLIVSSDYHIPISCLLFSAEAFLTEWKTGSIPYRVAGNIAFETNGDETYTSITTQAQYLWSLADPSY